MNNCDYNVTPVIKCKRIDINSEIGKAIEQYKLDNPHYQKIYTGKAGGNVYVSMFADTRNKQLFIDDVKILKLIADKYKYELYVRPFSLIKEKSNAEYLINGLLADRKTPKNGLKNILKSARKQNCKLVVIELMNTDFNIDTAIKKIIQIEKKAKSNLEEFILIDEKNIKHFKLKKATGK